jgi:hypothetical protein
MTQDTQLNAFFSTNGTTPTPTPSPTGAPTPTPSPTATPAPNMRVPSLSFYCSSSATTSGFNVQIQGALGYNGTGLTASGITFSYSANNGATWHDLAYLITGDYGNFSGTWMPAASGYYMVKGTWAGDIIYAPVSQTINFAVQPAANQNQNVFSVTSNSTVSSLAFDSSQNHLSFTVSGDSGTTGFVQVCIPKSLMADISKLQVALDGSTVQYSAMSNTDDWLITIQYHHSTHSVIMTLGSAPTNSPTIPPTNPPTNTQTNPPTNTITQTPTATPYAPEYPLIIMVVVIMLAIIPLIVLQKKKIKT